MDMPGTDEQFGTNITSDNLFDVHWDIFGFGGSPSEWAQPFLPISQSSSRGNELAAQPESGDRHNQANNAATTAKLRKRRGKTATVRFRILQKGQINANPASGLLDVPNPQSQGMYSVSLRPPLCHSI